MESRRKRRDHSPQFRAKVALAALKEDQTWRMSTVMGASAGGGQGISSLVDMKTPHLRTGVVANLVFLYSTTRYGKWRDLE